MNNPVVFYGASSHVITVFDQLNKMYAPVAFCDTNPIKHGSIHCGLPVLSLDDVLLKYPECLFLVTTSERVKFEVISVLIDQGISTDRIINYEKANKYKSCRWLETFAAIDIDGEMRLCCSGYNRNTSPTSKKGENNKVTFENFIKLRDRLIAELNNPDLIIEGQCNSCLGCPEVREAYWSEIRQIRNVSILYQSLCNLKCSYCVIKYISKFSKFSNCTKNEMIESAESSLSLFNYLRKENQIDDNTLVELASGEISIHPFRDEILSAVENNPVWFYTNALIYNDKIADILSKGRSRLVSSIDSGTRETFLKIKGVDAFDKVCDNIKQYSKYGPIELKYIILPGVNDNCSDINGFVSLCENIGLRFASISRDFRDISPFDEGVIDTILDFVDKLRRANVVVSFPEFFIFDSKDKQSLTTL